MPILGTRGSLATIGYGGVSGPPIIIVGSLGVFGVGTSSTNKYGFSSDAVAAGTNFTAAQTCRAAAGTADLGIFALGGAAKVTNKYTYAGDVVTTAALLVTNAASNGCTACGNSTLGIFAMAGATPGSRVTNKYTYSGDGVAAATLLTVNFLDVIAGVGNSTVGVFANSAATRITNKYTYGSDTVGAGTNLIDHSPGNGYALSAAGTSTFGIFALGTPANTEKYTYAGDTVVDSTSLTGLGSLPSAAGNDTVGIFAPGNAATNLVTNKYTYAGDAVSVATNLLANPRGHAAASNGTTGVNV